VSKLGNFKRPASGNNQEKKMRNKLMVTVAMAALISGTTFAIAQQEEHGGPAAKPGATEQHAAPGGAMQHPQGPAGAMQHQPVTPGGAAQNQDTPDKDHAVQRGAEENGNAGVNAQTQQHPTTQENAQTQEHGNANQGTTNTAHTGAPSGGKSVQLSETQRTQVKNIVVQNHEVARVNNVNFNISVGTAVPRSVHVEVLPADIVTIVPEYRGFNYIVVGDQLLIIDPNSLEIVAVLPV
jgi:hypothetical protein